MNHHSPSYIVIAAKISAMVGLRANPMPVVLLKSFILNSDSMRPLLCLPKSFLAKDT